MSEKHSINKRDFVRHYVAKETILGVRTSLARVKVCRVSFGSDGSIYVSFPYMKEKRGIVSLVQEPAQSNGRVDYDLRSGGAVVETDVKFSHHASGVVQFSKSGLEQRLPRRTGFPLTDEGVVFQLHLWWLGGFKWVSERSKKDLHLETNFVDDHPFGVAIEARWWNKSVFETNAIREPGGPNYVGPRVQAIHKPTGREEFLFLVAPPKPRFSEKILAITMRSIPVADGADVPTMVFIGGFAPPGQPSETGCLAFLYPYNGQHPDGQQAVS